VLENQQRLSDCTFRIKVQKAMTTATLHNGEPARVGAPVGSPAVAAIPQAHDVVSAARGYLHETGRVVLATVIETWGSAPVPIGGQMAVAPDGRFAGSVSGGCIEGDVMMAALAALKTGQVRVVTFGVAHDAAQQAGLPCGGNIKVLVEPLAGDAGLVLIDQILEATSHRRGLVVATDLKSGARRVLPCPIALDTPVGGLATRLNGGESRIFSEASGEVFYKSHAPPSRVVIVGASHIGQLLSEMAQLAGYGVVIVDPREGYAVADRFAGVPCHPQWPKDALGELGLDAFTAVVALAHVAHIDDEALMLALRSDCHYVGALGSRANHAKRAERLAAEGFTAGDVGRVKAPIGLNIGARTPAEIAVAILAEIIASVRGGPVA
jgi:xanthine dehydrogenase accessory factor